VDAPVLVGKTVEDAVNFQLAIGPAGEVFREAGEEAEAKRHKQTYAPQQTASLFDHDVGLHNPPMSAGRLPHLLSESDQISDLAALPYTLTHSES
jgi:hypothetical protein